MESEILQLIQSSDLDSRIQAAKEIRRLTKTSHRCRRGFSAAILPLVDMLRLDSAEANDAALLALLNLAVKDEMFVDMLRLDSVEPNDAALLALLNLAVKDEINKICIVNSGALDPILKFLISDNTVLQEHATASLLTLSASSTNKPIIGLSGAIPLLVQILKYGTSQAKADSVLALYNLSTHLENVNLILEAQPIAPLIDLLIFFKKSSKTTEKGTALIESLMSFDEGRISLTREEGGILAVVEVLESGSLQSREHAVGALLTMCENDRIKYREPILKEGVIPGLLELTVQGTPKSQTKAKTLLRMLRESPYPRSEMHADTLENIVCNFLSQIEGEDQSGKAKKMLADMVQVSMEQSLRHLQQRALICTPAELPIKVPSE